MKNAISIDAIGELFTSNKLQKLKYFLGLMLCVFGIGSNITAAPSDFDTTFGTNGSVVFYPSSTVNIVGSWMVLQPDGKIVMVGTKNPATTGFAVARFNANGSLDATFGNNGVVETTFGGNQYEQAVAVAVQTDGKVVVAGHSNFPDAQGMAVLRLNSNGSTDTAFGVNGVRIIPFTSFNGGYLAYCGAMKIAPDGKIVVGGNVQGLNVDRHSALARLNPDGSFDATFGNTTGRITTGGFFWNDLTILPDNSIVAVGHDSIPWVAINMTAAKFNANGTQSWYYTRSGGASIPFNYLYGVAPQADGKFVIVGDYNNKVSVMRLNADGTSDGSFNNDLETIQGRASSVAVQTDGKIVVSAAIGTSSNTTNSLIRLNPDGSRDRGFGSNGIAASFPFNARKVIIQPDGKILVGGNGGLVMARHLGGASAPLRTAFDYDGDGKADVSVFRPSENRWYILKSSDSSVVQPFFGAPGDVPTPADYDGDGKTDVAIWRPADGVWWYLSSVSGAQIAAQWGASGDIPRPFDFDGDGRTDFVVYRPSEGKWYRLGSAGGNSSFSFGSAGDKPVIGDFDGDGKSDYAIYRPSTGVWWYAASGAGNVHRAVQFGASTDVPVAADYDGDGKTDFAVYRPSNGGWYILNSSTQNYVALPFGEASDKPVTADYDGDGKADVSIFRPSTGSWYLLGSTNGFSGAQWGIATDIPTQNSFVQ